MEFCKEVFTREGLKPIGKKRLRAMHKLTDIWWAPGRDDPLLYEMAAADLSGRKAVSVHQKKGRFMLVYLYVRPQIVANTVAQLVRRKPDVISPIH